MLEPGTIVYYPNDPEGEYGIVLTHEDWIARYGGGGDGLGPEEWGDDEWTGAWFPAGEGMLGEHGDLDRAGPTFWQEVTCSPKSKRLVDALAAQALKGPQARGVLNATIKPNLYINLYINREEK